MRQPFLIYQVKILVKKVNKEVSRGRRRKKLCLRSAKGRGVGRSGSKGDQGSKGVHGEISLLFHAAGGWEVGGS